MLIGGVAVYVLFFWFGVICNVWKGHPNVRLADHIATKLLAVFPAVSLLNISIIALERAYDMFRPLRHRVLKKMGVWPINCLWLGCYIWVWINCTF